MSAPRWARALLRLCVPAWRREDVIGDLNEMHARRLASGGAVRAWLATSAEALGVAVSFLVARRREQGYRRAWITWPEARLALRVAYRHPLLNVAVVLALGTGLGLAGAAFTLVDTTFFGRLPLPGGERFVRTGLMSEGGGTPATIELERFELFARAHDTFEYLGAAADGSTNLLGSEGQVESLRGVVLSADAFRVLPYRPVLGRTLVASDGEAGAAPVVLLSQRVWERRFGSDAGVIGRSVNLAGAPHEVVGVMPAGAGFPNHPDLWIPLRPRDFAAEGTTGRAGLVVFGVLREGVAPAAAEARLVALSAGFEAERAQAQRLRVSVRPFTEVPQRSMMQVFLGSLLTAVLAVVLVIASNVGNLVAARTAARRAELGVRAALGASRWRLVAQLFGETLVLAAVAMALAAWGLHELMARLTVWLGHDLPFWVDLMPGAASWMFLVLVGLVASLVAGALPALRATRGAPGDALRPAGRAGAGAVLGRTAAVMAVLQVACSVALLGGALLAVRGMARYAGARPSVPDAHVLTAGMALDRGDDPDSARAVLERIEAAVSRMPGVERSGFATSIPGVEAPVETVQLEALQGESPEGPRAAPVARARPGFLEALGAAPVLGRLLAPEDLLDGGRRVAVVNESFVRKFLRGRNPLGRRVRILSATESSDGGGAQASWREIVGVVPDLGLSVGDPEMEAGLYVPLTEPSWGYLVLSVRGDPAAVADPLRRTLARVQPDLLVPRVETLDRAGSRNATALGLFGGLLSALGGMALLLSLVSTYALVSFTVSRRVREVGIRVALGASRVQVLRSVAGKAALHTAAGAALGVPLGALLVQAKRLFVFRVPSGEPWLLPLVALLMIAAGALASWVPARRALRVGPSEALRAE